MAKGSMTFTEHPRLLARIAGAFYLIITAFALFAYMYVRGQLIDTGDMARTADNIVANEHLFRIGFTAAVIVTMCNLPLGFILYELFKVVNPRLALLALVFIIASATLEAVNSYNYLAPLITFTLPEYLNAFDAEQRQALARAPIRFGQSVASSTTATRFVVTQKLSRRRLKKRPECVTLPVDSLGAPNAVLARFPARAAVFGGYPATRRQRLATSIV